MDKKYEIRDCLIRIILTLIFIFTVPLFAYFVCGFIFGKMFGIIAGYVFLLAFVIITLCNLSDFIYCIFDEKGLVIRSLSGKSVEVLWRDVSNYEYKPIYDHDHPRSIKPLCLLIYTDYYAHTPNSINNMPKSGYAITFRELSFTAKTAKAFLNKYS